MELHRNRESITRKEIRCTDCGQIYFAAKESLSSICTNCGNIEFFGKDAKPLSATPEKNPLSAKTRPESILSARILAQLQLDRANQATVAAEKPAEKKALDPQRIESLLHRYQVEWQLWQAVTQNFADEHYHVAYLSLTAQALSFDTAIDRYREHSKTMQVIREELWQTEVCDSRIEKLQSLALLQLERSLLRSKKDYSFLTPRLASFARISLAVLVVLYFYAKVFHAH